MISNSEVLTRDKALKKDMQMGFYAEWDKDEKQWGVFGLETGFCYEQFVVEDMARDKARDMNDNYLE